MKLTVAELKNTAQWEKYNIKLPKFSIEKMLAQTKEKPEWVHFGAGNIFRGFIGSINQKLLNNNDTKTGIIAVETFDFDIIDKIYKPFNNLTLSVVMDAKSNLDIEVLAGIADGIKSTEFEKLKTIFENPSLKMVSYTITEKGYAIYNLDGSLMPVVAKDIENGPGDTTHAMSVTAALLYHRYKNGAYPLAVVSMDNCSHNGEKLKNSVMKIAEAWCENNMVEAGFITYLNEKISFPWSMIDKITPRPSDAVKERLINYGIDDIEPIITSKNTYIAPFVNAETAEYLVIEDDFPNGRPPLEKAGVYMTTREIVNKSETMKVTTCLNPLHTALAVFGCILGYHSIWEEMNDKELNRLVKNIADEGIKVVVNPEIIDPKAFVTEVIDERLPNPNIPDMPQRIATDTSQKVGIRYGETIKSYMKSSTLDTKSLNGISMAIAGWLRYLLAVDDNGNTFNRSSDPMLDELTAALKGIEYDKPESVKNQLTSILSNKALFGIDLYEAGLGKQIETYFKSMLGGNGSVRKTLQNL
ncbi:MAG: mannitol dehydrogenase family protein [Clostridia bacterium]|nr:mannitol dehydrogenase family protein [Clostridia bacterium]